MFSARRFSRLVAVHWAERWRSYVWLLVGVVVLHLLAILTVTSAGTSPETYSLVNQQVLFYLGFALSSGWLAAGMLAGLSRQGAAIILLMRPASAFEKWLLALLVICVVHPLAYTLVFQVFGYPAALLAEQAGEALQQARLAEEQAVQAAKMAAMAGKDVLWMSFDGDVPRQGHYLPIVWPEQRLGIPLEELYLWSLVSAVSGLVVAGTLYFRRWAVFKAVATVAVTMMVLIPLLVVATSAYLERLFWVDNNWITPLPLIWIIAIWVGIPALVWFGNLGLLKSREVA